MTRRVRARYDDTTITVYQAYSHEIADAALRAGTFVPPFKRERMTWIKPSFLWMMYRSGWATKPGQERVLTIEITRIGFEWALANSCLSSFDASYHQNYEDWRHQLSTSPVRIQWDPERDLTLRPLPNRAIQIGLKKDAIRRYIGEWITSITDCTALTHQINSLVAQGKRHEAHDLLPHETEYPISAALRDKIGSK